MINVSYSDDAIQYELLLLSIVCYHVFNLGVKLPGDGV
jgi:hypothetical protein